MAGRFWPIARVTGLVFVQIDLAQNRHRVALFQMGNDLALESGLAAGIDVGGHFAGPGTSVNAGSVMALAGAAALCFLCLTGAALVVASTAGAGVLGAGATAADGAGMGGSVFGLFVLFCATALVAIIAPKINQQFIFIFPEVKSLSRFLSMSAIGPVSARPA